MPLRVWREVLELDVINKSSLEVLRSEGLLTRVRFRWLGLMLASSLPSKFHIVSNIFSDGVTFSIKEVRYLETS